MCTNAANPRAIDGGRLRQPDSQVADLDLEFAISESSQSVCVLNEDESNTLVCLCPSECGHCPQEGLLAVDLIEEGNDCADRALAQLRE
jgi:hypothetical protein